MTEFPINWQLQRGSNVHQTKNCYISNYKINAEWSLICLWSSRHQIDGCRPELLEIRRNSTFGDILVSGTFKLMRNQTCVLQRKFIQLIEDGLATTLLELNYSSGSFYNQGYSLTGTLTIPASAAHKANEEGVNFDSLLELSSDFGTLLDPKTTYFSDMNLKCGTVSFSVHKSILSARSAVFAAMFTSEMKESRENKVTISDISPHILKTMLIYIYTGKTGALSFQNAGELLFGADIYQLNDLKKVCCDYLKSCISVENALKILVLGDFHEENLKVFAMDYICNSKEEFEVLEKTAEWKNLREKRPSLAMDVLTLLVKSKDLKLRRFK